MLTKGVIVCCLLVAIQASVRPDVTTRVAGEDTTIIGHPMMLERYQAFMKRNVKTSSDIDASFTKLDRDNDGFVSKKDFKKARMEGIISALESATLISFDSNKDGKVSLAEWRMGPLHLRLHMDKQKRLGFPKATSFVEVGAQFSYLDDEAIPEARPLKPLRRQRKQKKSRTDGGSLLSMEEQVHVTSAEHQQVALAQGKNAAELLAEVQEREKRAAAMVRYAEQQVALAKRVKAEAKRGRSMIAAANKARGRARARSEPTEEAVGPTRPQSKFGIPSYADEQCVMCQFFIQKTENALYHKIAEDPSERPSEQLGAPAVDPIAIKKAVAKLQVHTGGRGIARLTVEDTLMDFCDAGYLPAIFYPYCQEFWKHIPVFSKSIFYGYGADMACVESKMCNEQSYFTKGHSVHHSAQSRMYNGMSGMCGFLGGPHPRKGITASMCQAAQTL